jgi:hypothetical protein
MTYENGQTVMFREFPESCSKCHKISDAVSDQSGSFGRARTPGTRFASASQKVQR